MLISDQRLRRVVTVIAQASGSDAAEAAIVAEHLVEATLRGHDSHGVIRLPQYVDAVAAGTMRVNRRPATVLDAGSILALDGGRGYGQVAALAATDLGVARARQTGVALVSVSNSGHFGRMGAWAERAAAAGQATIYFANAARPGGAGLAPFGGTDRRIHAGPICLGMPAGSGEPVILDMSTAAVAIGKVRLARNQGTRLREACIVGPDDALTDDPHAFFPPLSGPLLPFGGHKGYGLCVFTDLFGGILGGGGANYAGEAGPWFPTNSMIAIHIELARLGEPGGIAEQVRRYIDWVTASPPQRGAEVLMPGARSARTRAERLQAGITLDDATWAQIVAAGARCGVAPYDLESDELGSAAPA